MLFKLIRPHECLYYVFCTCKQAQNILHLLWLFCFCISLCDVFLQEPKELYDEQRIIPIFKIDRQAEAADIKKHIDNELTK